MHVEVKRGLSHLSRPKVLRRETLWLNKAMDAAAGGDGIGKKAGNCHRANAPGYWRDGTCNFGAGCVIYVADKACSTLWFINAVDAHIDHGCTWFDPIAWYHFGATNSRHNNIRAAHDGWQILGP